MVGVSLQRFLVEMNRFFKIPSTSLQFTQIKVSQGIRRIKCNGGIEIISGIIEITLKKMGVPDKIQGFRTDFFVIFK